MEEARKLLAESLRIAPARIGDACRMGELREWDSLAHMGLIALVEERFAVSLTMDQIVEMVSLEGLAGVLSGLQGAS